MINHDNYYLNKPGLNYISEMALAFRKSRVLFTACELGIFNIIGDSPKTSKDIAQKAECNEKAMERLLNSLVSIKLLEKSGSKFANSEISSEYLVYGSSEYLGNMDFKIHLLESWNSLTESIKKGGPVVFSSLNEKSDSWIKSYAMSFHWKSTLEAPGIINRIPLKGVKNVLDLGGGTGQYSVEMLRTKPDIRAVVFDIPRITDIARENIGSHGYADNIDVVEGDFTKDNLGKGYDLVFVSYVLNEFSIWDNMNLFRRIYESLNYDGYVVINEVIIDDDRVNPQKSALLSLNLLVNTLNGDVYTETDVWVILKEAWFRNIELVETEFESSLIIAQK